MSLLVVLGVTLSPLFTQAGYLSVNVTAPTQCGNSTVQWWGDDGPYHLLLTPTAFVEHGYNVWIPSIDQHTNKYNLSINQPAGTQFLLTVWGSSGIKFAGTTDVITVGPQTTGVQGSCFLSDAAILSLYTFAFNISDTSNDYPPQCSNLTMSWPTSLESNVTSDSRRAIESTNDNISDISSAVDSSLNTATTANDTDLSMTQMDSSSSKTKAGNTTTPPTMFGIIPLGNSFSLPITYSRKSKFAQTLPSDSLSDTPTTYTSQGITHLNWTVDMAKGTRFILVAGIGSDEQWASGGSTALMTVGQGTTGCVSFYGDGDGAPSVTATGSDTSTNTPTSVPDETPSSPHHSSVVRTIIACVISIFGTLLLVSLCLFCYRARRRRRQSSLTSSFPSSGKQRSGRGDIGTNGSTSPTQLDLLSPSPSNTSPIRENRENRLGLTPLHTSLDPFRDETPLSSPSMLQGQSTNSSQGYMNSNSERYNNPSSISTLTTLNTLPTINTIQIAHNPHVTNSDGRGIQRGDSQDLLLRQETTSPRRLTLHDSSSSPLPSLENDTKAESSSGIRNGRNRRREREREMQYVIHQDGGRIRNVEEHEERVELPPRYEELDWDGIRRQEGDEVTPPVVFHQSEPRGLLDEEESGERLRGQDNHNESGLRGDLIEGGMDERVEGEVRNGTSIVR
ncbi:hypothetical protein M231_01008 [Tremella mesenterica]|uniref:Mid2 domain-containing protein n=1 Tax=Tremella mesenterica TaxID=5217 RepID=A0A4Q1BUH6_TREME|nr:hypothetical protein M231_01008 [Tremella mesenterica]